MCNKIAIWWAGIRNTEISPERTWFVLTSSQVGTMSIMGKARNVNTTSRAKASSQSASRLVIGISEAAGHLDMDYSIECLLPVHTMALYIRMISHPVVGCHVDHSNENIITHVCSVVPWLWWGQQNDTCATENVYVCVCMCAPPGLSRVIKSHHAIYVHWKQRCCREEENGCMDKQIIN